MTTKMNLMLASSTPPSATTMLLSYHTQCCFSLIKLIIIYSILMILIIWIVWLWDFFSLIIWCIVILIYFKMRDSRLDLARHCSLQNVFFFIYFILIFILYEFYDVFEFDEQNGSYSVMYSLFCHFLVHAGCYK